jgi:hypothetical protein
MATKLEIYNLALHHMRGSSLATITDDVEARYVLDDFWDITLQEMLEAGFWKFAMRTAKITEDTSIVAAFGYSYAHNVPSDWVKTYYVSASEFALPLHDEFVEEGNLWFSNVTPLYVRYVSDHATGYGGDLTRWTARATIALSRRLALYAAPKAMGSSGASLEKMIEQADSSLTKAVSFEALREPSKRTPEGRWNSMRGNGWSRTGHYWDR